MALSIIKEIKRIYYKIIPDHILYKKVVLPAKYLRYCGSSFYDNEHYLASALNEANRLINVMGINKDSTILDVGCGVGRLAIGLVHRLPEIKNYYGIDVSERAIAWCQKYLQSRVTNFQFIRINMKNALYNKMGEELNSGISLAFSENEFDAIYLYSVFSHMKSSDIKSYLNEFRRIIKRDGKIFLTAFVEEEVEDEIENPPNYRMKWVVPLHCVRYNRTYFNNMVNQCGFKINEFQYEIETDGQSGIYLSLLKAEP